MIIWVIQYFGVFLTHQRTKKITFSVIVIKSDVKIPSAQSGLVMTALNRGNGKEEIEPAALYPENNRKLYLNLIF